MKNKNVFIRIAAAVCLCFAVLAAVLIAAPTFQTEEKEAADAEPSAGGAFPYDDRSSLDYAESSIDNISTGKGNYVFNEIGESELEMYRQFCDDGSGTYQTAGGVMMHMQRRFADSELQIFGVAPIDGDVTKHKNYSQYLIWGGNCENGKKIADYLLDRNDNSIVEICSAAELFSITATISGCTVNASGGEDIGLINDETAGFMEYLRKLYDSENASGVSDTKVAAAYFHEIIALSENQETERFVYYAYFKTNGSEYLVHMVSQPTATADSLPYSPTAYSKPLSQEESRQLFCDLVSGITEVLK